MTKYEIVLHPDKILKKKCLPINVVSDEIRMVGKTMLDTMYEAHGIGLAAPQVGILKRIFVMDCMDKDKISKPFVCINPEIIWASEKMSSYEEGCLSIPEFYGEVERPAEIKLRCFNEDGKILEHHFCGLEATCAQHEIDHLNGILFIDYLGTLRKQIITSKMKKFKKNQARLISNKTTGE